MRHFLLITSTLIIAVSLSIILRQSFMKYDTEMMVYGKNTSYLEWLLPSNPPVEKLYGCGTINLKDSYQQKSGQPNGKILFLEKCVSCHSTKMSCNSSGIALKGVQLRWVGREKKLYQFIRNYNVLLQKKDPYTKALYKEYGMAHTLFPKLTDDEITEILRFVEN